MNANILHNINDVGAPNLLDITAIIKDPGHHSDYSKLLENIQGNILKDHGRDHALHVFLGGFAREDAGTITAGIQNLAEATYWLRNKMFTEQQFHYVASAREQYQLSRLSDISDDEYGKTYFLNFVLSKKGFEALGKKAPDDRSFLGGLKAAPKRFLDEFRSQLGNEEGISLASWESKYDDVHAMILIAHQDKKSLVDEYDQPMIRDPELRKLLEPFLRYIVAIEYGHVMYDKDGQNAKLIEHFGFQDGISNPLFYIEDLKKRESQDIKSHPLQNGTYSAAAPLELALFPDPNCQPDECAYGSYVVVAKLEQNVKGFHEAIKKLSEHLEGDDEDERLNRAKALVMGRYPDGTPIALQEKDGGIVESPSSKVIVRFPNNFDYPLPSVPGGINYGPCPVQAHIRRANGRNYQASFAGELGIDGVRSRRIVRRGITYGKRNPEPKDHPSFDQLPTKDVGLLFMCFQASIQAQFEWIITMWILYSAQRDAMVAAKPEAKNEVCNTWPVRWDEAGSSPFACYTFERHVTLKGGEYFFAPSLTFLRGITK